jgi:hypothetical protein
VKSGYKYMVPGFWMNKENWVVFWATRVSKKYFLF